ncbi:MAG: hypothetical protein M3N14_08080 [Bacteroidota bacterium]|nr:hypothetical protein [Bacteroidota bacterium]
MKMQDNQFDDLFRSKFENFESEPSGGVWEGIEYHLGNKKIKRSLFPFMGIAASILVLIVAGVLFVPQKIKISDEHPARNKAAGVNKLSNVITPIRRHDKIANNVGLGISGTTHSGINRIPSFPVSLARYKTPAKGDVRDGSNPSVKPRDTSVLVSIPQKQQEVINPVVPDKSVELTALQSLTEPSTFKTEPVLLATQVPANNTQDKEPAKPRHKIHNMGDLINVVVAKVDKRKDKFIEFTDADDDESNITGVNLGIIKIKKEK